MMNEQKFDNVELASAEKLKQALHKIREQQQYVTDLTTLPFKLFDVNKQSKQYKTHLIRQRSSKYNLVKLRSSHDTLYAKRQLDLDKYVDLRAQIFNDTQKLAAMDLVIRQRAAAEVEAMKNQMIKTSCWNSS